jgi:integrase
MTSTGDSAGITGHELKLAGVDQVHVDQVAGVDQAAGAGQLETAFMLAIPDPVAVYLASLGSVESRRTMTGSLDRLASLLTGRPGTTATEIPWHLLRPEHTTAIRAQLLAAYAPSTSRKMLSALSGVLKQCWRLKLMERDDYDRTVDSGSVDGSTLTGADAGRHVDAGELRALFGAGLRRAECTALDLDDYRQASGELEIDGKGGRVRLGNCGTGVRAAVEDWIAVRGDEPGSLLSEIFRELTQPHGALTALAAALALAPGALHQQELQYEDLQRLASRLEELTSVMADMASAEPDPAVMEELDPPDTPGDEPASGSPPASRPGSR